MLPDRDTLASGLNSILVQAGRPSIQVLERRSNAFASTFPSETVTVTTGGGGRLELFCKFNGGKSHTSLGHRGRVPYEARVYESILQHSTLTLPTYLGHFDDASYGGTCLVLESLQDAAVVKRTAEPALALERAARWIAQFQAETEKFVDSAEGAFLQRYDADYYSQWSRRAANFAGHWHRRLPWFAGLCARFEDLATELAQVSRSVVHGEFVSRNILVRRTEIYPIDWESTAVGLAEIDLASLTDKWPDPIRLACERAYRTERAALTGEDDEFARRLDMARVYWDFRWLGDRPEWTVQEKVGARFEHLRATAERLGMLA